MLRAHEIACYTVTAAVSQQYLLLLAIVQLQCH